jgi:hypothetical protein
LGHTSNKFIKLSIGHLFGLEKLNGKKFSEHQKCPSCIIGKSQLNDKPESIKRAEKPLAKVNFKLISSSVTSIEGYNYCAVLTDDCSECRWAYGLKTKEELLDAVKQWYAEIADLLEKYQLLVVMRDFAGEKLLKTCPMRFKNSSPKKVSRATSPHHMSHGKMVWVKQASTWCPY